MIKATGLFRRQRIKGAGRRVLRRDRALPPALEWVEDMTGHCPRITAVLGHSLMVENHTGISVFSDTCIELNSRIGSLRATGHRLSLSCAKAGALIIRGDIRRIDLPCQGGDSPDER